MGSKKAFPSRIGLGMFIGSIFGAVIGLLLWIQTGNYIFSMFGSTSGLCIGLAIGVLASDRNRAKTC